MGTTAELIQTLHDQRLRAAESHKALVDDVEARGNGWTAEDDQRKERIDGELDSLRKRIDALISLQEVNASLDEQRGAFEKIVRPAGDVEVEQDSADDRFRRFMRAGLPGFENESGPKSIEVAITPEVKRIVMAARHAGKSVDDVEFHDLVKGTTTAGGFTVPTSFAARLYEHLVERAGVRRTRAEVLTTASGESLQVPKTTSHGTDAGIITEGSAITEADPAFGQVTMGAYKYAKLVQVSSELAVDTAIDLLGYVARAAG